MLVVRGGHCGGQGGGIPVESRVKIAASCPEFGARI